MGLTVWVPLIWGFCESTFFFVIVDVWLTWMVMTEQKIPRILTAMIFAALGSLSGAWAIYFAGKHYPYDQIAGLLDIVPGINLSMIQEVGVLVKQSGFWTYMFGGMWQGVPFKIYAFQWGAMSGSLFILIMFSIAARLLRFMATALLALLVRETGKRFVPGWPAKRKLIFIAIWSGFYVLHFLKHPF